MNRTPLPTKQQAEPPSCLAPYQLFLQEQERSKNTIEKYLRDVRCFLWFVARQYAQGQPAANAFALCKAAATPVQQGANMQTGAGRSNAALPQAALCKSIAMLQQEDAQPTQKIVVLAFKEHLVAQYAPASVNSMLAAVNHFLAWLGRQDCCVKPLKIQRETFCRAEQELTEQEYQKLLATAEESGQYKLSLLLQSICATGIRVSELSQITVEALRRMQVTVSCKGKRRLVFLPKKLCERLNEFCRAEHITSGAVFRTRTGKEIDRSNIWKMMQRLCKKAGVPTEKGFPHNLRHLFARTFYKHEKDIARLSDVLGHSNVNTTRIYLMETGKKHAQQVNRLDLLYPKNHVRAQCSYQKIKKGVTT